MSPGSFCSDQSTLWSSTAQLHGFLTSHTLALRFHPPKQLLHNTNLLSMMQNTSLVPGLPLEEGLGTRLAEHCWHTLLSSVLGKLLFQILLLMMSSDSENAPDHLSKDMLSFLLCHKWVWLWDVACVPEAI